VKIVHRLASPVLEAGQPAQVAKLNSELAAHRGNDEPTAENRRYPGVGFAIRPASRGNGFRLVLVVLSNRNGRRAVLVEFTHSFS